MSARVGILGGTFDPIHQGHLDLGDCAQRALDLTTVLVIPASRPPHRSPPVASGFHRFAMVALAIAGRAGWRVSDLELTHTEPSYTATTLQRLHDQGYGAADLFFVIGADAFLEIRSWKDYPAILDRAQFAVVSRRGYSAADLRQRLPMLSARMVHAAAFHQSDATSIILIDAPTADVSSTAIRERCRDGHSLSGLVPAAVEQHIEQHGLYRSPIENQPGTLHHVSAAAGRLHGQS
jgi:nicotinate-nucleotide adenylyltransferase